MFKHILAATDLVDVSDPVVEAAAKIAAQNQAALHILHVPESAREKDRLRVNHFQSGEEIDFSSDYAKELIRKIESTHCDMLPLDADVKICVAPGYPWQEIIRYARRINASMIVLGPHSGRAGKKGVVRVAGKIGSTVEGVVMRENCPVMIVNASVRITSAVFKKIVVGVDFSVSCECALSFARQVSEKFGSFIYPFHMIPVPPYPKYSSEDYDADRAATQKRLTEFCGDFIQTVPHEFQIGAGALPHLEIIKCAEKNDADLIVMGSHTKEKDRKWYAGSVVERTAFRSKCPVVVITDPAALLAWDENSRDAAAIGRDKDRTIHVFTRERQS